MRNVSNSRLCQLCGNGFHFSLKECPHCGRPGLYPNVFAANQDAELEVLKQRYNEAIEYAVQNGGEEKIRSFEDYVLNAKAIIALPHYELSRLVNRDNTIYASFYSQLDGDSRFPEDNDWDDVRSRIDETLFPNYKEQIRFASLVGEGCGLQKYGDCSVVLKEDMISFRASVFEENSVLFCKKIDGNLAIKDDMPKGHRASWDNRALLCVSKLFNKVVSSVDENDFADILVSVDNVTGQDDFIEVHIFGGITIFTAEKVIVMNRAGMNKAIFKAMKLNLNKKGVLLEEL